MIYYRCRHCEQEVGSLSSSVKTTELGFQHLTDLERLDMITYCEDGTFVVRVICEDCHEALMRNPSLYEIDRLIQ